MQCQEHSYQQYFQQNWRALLLLEEHENRMQLSLTSQERLFAQHGLVYFKGLDKKRVVQGYSRNAWLADFIFFSKLFFAILDPEDFRDSWRTWIINHSPLKASWFWDANPPNLRYAIVIRSLHLRFHNFAFFRHPFLCRNRLLKRVYLLLIYVIWQKRNFRILWTVSEPLWTTL